ncbi:MULTISPECIES: hypothetical protein [unclassified Polaribacter]|uniref:hypothetical protein n=1 Tax=unclassified Polaribacter TaxID=196858 RepID=UPI0011BE55AB|nr:MULTISPECIES: hypothetical protein [unclassified Polaribacter]TXD53956.1 hypothetical protein ES043_02720 [Polaribacter sp. IC063]TXD59665.1 hypothetical protein ES044_09435 [Polaribacter sp. IC066]
MEKSINDIWTKGFENSNELSSPKIMNLYNQKSKLLINKIKKTSQTDNKSLLPIAILFAVAFGIAGHILLGFYGMMLIIGLFFFNRKLLSTLENIKITSSNYDYLIAYKKAIDKIITATFNLLGFGLPIILITGLWLYFRSSSKYATFINNYSFLNIVLIIIALATIISLVGISIYKITNHTLYRKHLKDLNSIISDLKNME